jgi:hypothetical protein
LDAWLSARVGSDRGKVILLVQRDHAEMRAVAAPDVVDKLAELLTDAAVAARAYRRPEGQAEN